jgi:hypothetical protein
MVQCTLIVTNASKAFYASIFRAEMYDERKQFWYRYAEKKEQDCQYGRTNRSKANREENILNVKLSFSEIGPHRNVDNDQTPHRNEDSS